MALVGGSDIFLYVAKNLEPSLGHSRGGRTAGWWGRGGLRLLGLSSFGTFVKRGRENVAGVDWNGVTARQAQRRGPPGPLWWRAPSEMHIRCTYRLPMRGRLLR